ncbi:DnaJ- protein scj1, partial [Ascosphaera atra]
MHSITYILGLMLLLMVSLSLCAEDHYKLLGLDKSAQARDIKKAFRTLSKKYHPDKNPGDNSAQQKFVEISEAYDVLSKPSTKKIYDQYGHEGLERHKAQGGGNGAPRPDPFNFFSHFMREGGPQFRQRGSDMHLNLQVPLRDFYNGAEVDIEVEKQVMCDTCEGSGAADGKVVECEACHGKGYVVHRQMIALGMIQQTQQPCGKCGGRGQTVKKPCKKCKGHRVVRQAVPKKIEIEPGTEKGARLVFENEADEHPDWVAGDLVVTLSEEEPELGKEEKDRTDGTFFRRRGKDLFWKELLSLREAWMGEWTRNITHLDGHVVRLSRERGQVVQPLAVEEIKGEGMPLLSKHLSDVDDDEFYGSLFV